ncbi:MAG: DUF4403 family protein [Salegentibacter sp.]
MQNSSEEKIMLKLPVRISFGAIEEFLRDSFIGETIGHEDKNGKMTNYASVLGLSFQKSPKEEYDISVELQVKMLTSFFHNRVVSLSVHASLFFDEDQEELGIKDYKLESHMHNWLLNKTLQTMINGLFYGKLKKKMSIDFRPHIRKQLEQANEKLSNRLQPLAGIFLSGHLEQLQILEVTVEQKHFKVMVELEANAGLEVEAIPF